MTGTGSHRGVYCRLTVLAPRARVDVALPVDVPLGELVPMVLELLGEPLAPPGPAYDGSRRPEPWRICGATGGPLPADATLGELGLLDGELLRIGPAAPAPAAPVFDDPVDALASTAGGGTGPAGARSAGLVAALGATVAAALLLAGVRAGTGVPSSVVALAVVLAGLAATGCLVRAAQLARGPGPAGAPPDPWVPAGGDLPAAVAAAVAAVPPAAAAGWAAAAGPPGAVHVLLAVAAAGTAAAVGQVVVRVVAPVLVGIVVATGLVGAAALLHLSFGTDVGTLAAGTAALTLVLGPLLPRAALRLAGLPRPAVPADAHELVAADSGPDRPDPAELAERADLARGYLAGLVGATAVVTAGGALLTAAAGAPDGLAGPLFAAVTAVALALRARGFADAAPVRTLLLAGIGAGTGLAVLAGLTGGPVARLTAAGGLLLAVAVSSVRTVRPGAVASPVGRRAVDLLEGLLVAAALPLALGAMGVYATVRGL